MPKFHWMLRASFVMALSPAAYADETSVKTFDACLGYLKKFLFERQRKKIDWGEVRDRFRPLAEETEGGEELQDLLNSMLADLDVSHASVMEREVYQGLQAELDNERVYTHGMLLEESQTGKCFVRALYEGSPAAKLGIHPGDRIVSVDDVPALKSAALVEAGYDPALPGPNLFFLRAKKGERLEVCVQPTPNSESRYKVTLAASKMNSMDAATHSIRIVKKRGVSIGTLHLWYCSEGVDEVLRRALSGPLATCDGIVLDVRGRGGYAHIADQILGHVLRQDRPVAILIDSRTRSAKEILAYKAKRSNAAILVGERTEGAVLGAGFFPLQEDLVLEMPIQEVPVGNHSLEGVGVEPHVSVEWELPYSEGLDPIFERGCDVIVEAVRRAKERKQRRAY